MGTRRQQLWAMLGMCLVVAACGSDGEVAAGSSTTAAPTASSTTTTVADVEASAPPTTEVSSTTVAPVDKEPESVEETIETTTEPETAPEDTEDDGGATPDSDAQRESAMALPELEALIRDVHGPTSDLAGEVSRVAYWPTDFPDIVDTEVLDLRIEMNHYRHDDSHYRSNIVQISTSLPIADAAAFYEEELAAQGYGIRSTGSQTDNDGYTTMLVDTELPGSSTLTETMNIVLREGDYPGTRVQLWYRGSEPYAGEVESFNTWLERNPMPAGGFATQSTFSTQYRTGDTPADLALSFTMAMEFSNVDEDEIRELFRRSVRDAGYEIRDDSDLALPTVWLAGDDTFRDTQVSFYTGSGSNGDYSSINLVYRRQ